MQNNYESFTAEQFLDDAFFIQWIKEETKDANDFWNNWMESHPANLSEMRMAEQQLRAILSVTPIRAEKIDEQEVWTRIENTINATPARIGKISQSWLWAAAAILIIMASGYFLINQGNQKKEIAVINKNIQVNDIAPGGNKATLTLANGTTIILDSVQNGKLTQQGNAKITKLDDGQLAYDKSGLEIKDEILYNTISTPRGGQYQLTLSDGSKVWLNAESSLRFPAIFAGNERKVELTGEGYFEVAHNAEIPFHVSVNGADVQVLGTHFNVNAYKDEDVLKTTLLDGSVRVSNNKNNVVIRPGEQAAIATSSDKIKINKEVDLEEIMAWKNGKFVFARADIQTVMRQLSRWYNIEIAYQGNVKSHFGGSVSMKVPISKVFEMLRMTGGANFEIEGNKVTVRSGDTLGN